MWKWDSPYFLWHYPLWCGEKASLLAPQKAMVDWLLSWCSMVQSFTHWVQAWNKDWPSETIKFVTNAMQTSLICNVWDILITDINKRRSSWKINKNWFTRVYWKILVKLRSPSTKKEYVLWDFEKWVRQTFFSSHYLLVFYIQSHSWWVLKIITNNILK